MVAVRPASLHAYEIKGKGDDLRHLVHQALQYECVFDRITIVVTLGLLAGVLERIPDHWGVIAATEGPRGGARLRTLRRASRNPNVQPLELAQLLWKEEALSLLPAEHATRLAYKPRREAYAQLIGLMSPSALRQAVAQAITRRARRSPDEQRAQGDD